MAPIFNPSTPVGHKISSSNLQIVATPNIDTALSYEEETPVNKFDMSPPLIVKSAAIHYLQQVPVDPISTEETDITDGGDDCSNSSGMPETQGPVIVDSSSSLVLSLDDDPIPIYSEAQIASIRKEWMGTSQLLDEQNIEMQLAGGLDSVIAWLKLGLQDLVEFPYDPVAYIQMGSSLNRIGFADVGAGYAYRAIILIQAGLGIEKVAFIPNLKELVIEAIQTRFKVSSEIIIEDELKGFHLEAHCVLLDGLMGSAAFWDGWVAVKGALKYFPDDSDILEMRNTLTEAFLAQSAFLTSEGVSGNELRALSRTGKIYSKKYPWLAEELFYRTPALIKDINKNFGSGNCEVRPVIFGPDAELGRKRVKEGEDVGPCGVFATRDIQAGEFLMVDQTVLGISDIPPTQLRHCEACHAAVFPPYLFHPDEFVPTCCRKVAYCSAQCTGSALEGYHKILCGKNIEWVYNLPALKGDRGLGSGWRPVIFQRAAAIILGDKLNGKHYHPLQHPLMARLGASYTAPGVGKVQPQTAHDFQFTGNIVAPTQTLLELGVDIFTTLEWAPEVIQTIILRIDNNANMASVVVEPGKKPIDMINVNPQYIFFNHSCEPNVNWHSALPNSDVSAINIMDEYGEVHRPGESTVFCDAGRDIKKGEQLFISYIGDPLGLQGDEKKFEETGGDARYMDRAGKRQWLSKWFDNGCGCVTCEKEKLGE